MELMVVLVLIAVMTAVIIPEMRGSYEEALLRSTSRNLVGAFDAASSRAITLNQIQRIHLDAGNGRYYLEKNKRSDDRSSAPPTSPLETEGALDKRIAYEVHPSDEPDKSSARETSENLEENQEQSTANTISFYPDGTADARDIVLKDRQGFRLVLRLNPVTARVKVLDANSTEAAR